MKRGKQMCMCSKEIVSSPAPVTGRKPINVRSEKWHN